MKPSELFEGENSSLRKTFNEAVKTDYSHTHCWNQKTPACGIPLEKHTQCCLCDVKVEEKISKSDLLEWANKSKKQNLNNSAWDEYAEGYNTALQDLKKFISGE
jgi:hypothetical protein